MGDEQLVHEVMQDLIHSITADLHFLQLATASADFARIREICHQLGSRLAQIKVPFYTEVREIELAVKESRIEGLTGEIEAVFPKMENLLTELNARFAESTAK